MSVSQLPDEIADLSQQFPAVQFVGARMFDEIAAGDIQQMRNISVEALNQQRPTIFVWDVREATRSATPDVRLSSLSLRTDLLGLLAVHELGTIMIAPERPVTRVLLRIIVKAMPRGASIFVVDDIAKGRSKAVELAQAAEVSVDVDHSPRIR